MEPPTFEAVERFIDIANDVTRRPMYVHCKAGIGRTGSMVSCWRISQGMDVEEARGAAPARSVYSSLCHTTHHHRVSHLRVSHLCVSRLRVHFTSVTRLLVRPSNTCVCVRVCVCVCVCVCVN